MKVKLKVLQGKSAGTEVNVSVAKFLIGRNDDCHLRPKSDAISRHHCVVTVKESEVYVRDLNSRNGTFVNNEKVTDKTFLKMGDVLRVGSIEFEVVIDMGLGGIKKPPVQDVAEVAARTAAAAAKATESKDFDLDAWLNDDSHDRMYRDPDTRQFRLDEALKEAAEKQENEPNKEDTVQMNLDETKKVAPPKAPVPEKKPPGKLPPRTGPTSNSSGDAAADMLRKFFNAR